MNETEELKSLENSLRDFIQAILYEKFGEEWLINCGISPVRINKWKEKKIEEIKKLGSGITEERLLYYSDFYDLRTIIEKNWSEIFKNVFDDLQKFSVYFKQLEYYRNPDAHRRELLTFQKHLIIGICGELRNKIVTYRSKMETDDDIYPRIESICDNYGNIWNQSKTGIVKTNIILYPGDILEFKILATDPQGGEIFYTLNSDGNWGKNNTIKIVIEEKHIAKEQSFILKIKSNKPYHADIFGYDDRQIFTYPIRPKK